MEITGHGARPATLLRALPTGIRMTGRGKVLLVEDEPLIAMDLNDMLTDAGYDVAGPVARADRAVELARAEELAGAIVDVRLSDDDGFAVADVLIEKGIPFFFVTGMPGDLPDRFATVPRVAKPFDRQHLELLVARLFVSPKP